jgi:hypothetical protein
VTVSLDLKPFLGALPAVAGIVGLAATSSPGLALLAIGLVVSISYSTFQREDHFFGPDLLERCVKRYEALIRNTKDAEEVSVEKGCVSGEPTEPYHKSVVTVPGHRIPAWTYCDGAEFMVDDRENSGFEWQDYREDPTGEKLIHAFLSRLEEVITQHSAT